MKWCFLICKYFTSECFGHFKPFSIKIHYTLVESFCTIFSLEETFRSELSKWNGYISPRLSLGVFFQRSNSCRYNRNVGKIFCHISTNIRYFCSLSFNKIVGEQHLFLKWDSIINKVDTYVSVFYWACLFLNHNLPICVSWVFQGSLCNIFR